MSTQLATDESLSCVEPNYPHIRKLWPIYSAHERIEKTIAVAPHVHAFAQDVGVEIVKQKSTAWWKVFGPSVERDAMDARAWFAFFMRYHPYMRDEPDRQWRKIARFIGRSAPWACNSVTDLVKRVREARFSHEAYGLRTIVETLAPKYGPFDLNPFCGVERKER